MSLLEKIRKLLREETPRPALVKRELRQADDFEGLSILELEEREQLLRTRIAQRELELRELNIQNERYTGYRNARQMLLEKYLHEIEELNAATPGGIRSVAPSEGDDPELVTEAFRIFCERRRGGGSRFG
jgi:hypothetical protein